MKACKPVQQLHVMYIKKTAFQYCSTNLDVIATDLHFRFSISIDASSFLTFFERLKSSTKCKSQVKSCKYLAHCRNLSSTLL